MGYAAGLYYEEHGPADGPPLIMSAGLGGSGSYWLPNVTALAKSSRVILYDHRGTGRSDRTLPEIVTVEDMGEDILALMDGLRIGKATILGHAAGGVAGLSIALNAPERITALLLVNAWSKPDPHFLRCFEARLTLLRNAGPRAYLAAQPIFLYPAAWSSRHAATLDREIEHQLAAFPGAEVYEKRIAALSRFDVDARLHDVQTPTVAIASTDDMLVPFTCSERLAAGIPGAQLATLPWGGHACNVTASDDFNKLLLEITSGD